MMHIRRAYYSNHQPANQACFMLLLLLAGRRSRSIVEPHDGEHAGHLLVILSGLNESSRSILNDKAKGLSYNI